MMKRFRVLPIFIYNFRGDDGRAWALRPKTIEAQCTVGHFWA